MEYFECDQNGCEDIATHSLVWTKEQRYCLKHFRVVMGTAEFMGFPTPMNTAKVISPLHLQVQMAIEAESEAE